MASKRSQPNRKAPDDPKTPLQCKYQGQYESGRITAAHLLFVGIGILTLFTLFSLLVKLNSTLSIFAKFHKPIPPNHQPHPYLPSRPGEGSLSAALLVRLCSRGPEELPLEELFDGIFG
jgi:hypothetical protein